jgi:oligopeptidase B
MVKRIPTTLETHGHGRIDDYYWLRERDNPEVIKYLNDENAFAAKELAHAQDFERKLFKEIKARIKQTDMSVPYKRDDYFYYTRYEEGKEYPIYARKRGVLDAAEEIMLDVNLLAVGHDFFFRRRHGGERGTESAGVRGGHSGAENSYDVLKKPDDR